MLRGETSDEIDEMDDKKSIAPIRLFFSSNAVVKPLVCLAGVIGVGKSTLAKSLSHQMNIPLFSEDVEGNPYLARFYPEMEKYAFKLQVYLLNKRSSQQEKIAHNGEGGLQDRSIYEDGIFAKVLNVMGFMDDLDYATYLELAEFTFKKLVKPTLIVYLYASPQTCMKRIKDRGREMESGITIEYITLLHDAYEAYFKAISKIVTVIKVDWEEYKDPERVAEGIANFYLSGNNVLNFDNISRFN